MKLMISAVALSRFPNASFALAYLFAPCSALEANMFEPISNPISSVPAMICVDPTDMITIVKSPVKNISKFAVLSCCSLRFTLCTVIIIIINMNIAVIIAAVQLIKTSATRNKRTNGQSRIHPVMLELVAPLITAPALSNFLNSSPEICDLFILFCKEFNNGLNNRRLKSCIIFARFCLNANSNIKSKIAPDANDISVCVTPLARYLFKTIITNKEGANAQMPIMKLDIRSIVATILSRKSCLIKLVIIVVFN